MTARKRAREIWGIQSHPGNTVSEVPIAAARPRRLPGRFSLSRWRGPVVSSLRLSGERVVEVEMLRERRSRHPIDRLSRRFDAVCTGAVDPQQIAASLEAEGINDRIARDRFALPDVFALASVLKGRVPLRIRDEDGPVPGRRGPSPSTGALLARGPAYLAPSLFFLGGGGFLRGSSALWVALTGLVLAWMLNQGFGVLVHSLLGRPDVAAAHRAVRQSLVMGTSLVVVMSLVPALVFFGDVRLVLLAGVQTAYLIGSASLLTLSEDRRLLAVLVPGSAVALAALIWGVPGPGVVVAAGGGTAAAVVAALLAATRRPAARRLVVPTREEARAAVMQALLGGVWASLIGLAGYAASPDPALMTTVGIAAAPVVLTMGVAEWRLVRFRDGADQFLSKTGDPGRFAGVTDRALSAGFLTYAAFLMGAVLAVAGAARGAGHLDAAGVRLMVGFAALGCAMFAGMALVSLGRVGFTLITSSAALASTLVVLLAAAARLPDPAVVYGVGCLVLFVVLFQTARDTSSQPVAYR